MRKRRLFFTTALTAAAATGISFFSVPIHAEGEPAPVNETAPAWTPYDGSVLTAYRFYLSTEDPDTRNAIDAQSPNGSIRADVIAYISQFTTATLPGDLQEVLADIRVYDPALPELAAPAEPAYPNPGDQNDPENPDKPGSGTETPGTGDQNPEQPSDPSNPDDGKKPGEGDQAGDDGKSEGDKTGGDQTDDKTDDPDKKDEKDPSKDEENKDMPPVSDKSDEEQEKEINAANPDGKLNELKPASDSDAPYVLLRSAAFSYRDVNRKVKANGLGWYDTAPNFNNDKAWRGSASSYNTPGLWGQCTWFAWGRFYEIYGFNPGFSGNGNVCVSQLVSAHPDKFVKSSTPKAGAVFSSDMNHNHVGIILDVNPVTKRLLVQEGNLDGVSNPNWNVAIQDYRTIELGLDDLRAMYGDVVFANPIEGKVKAVSQPPRTPKLNEKSLDEIRSKTKSKNQ